jgi:5-methylcytosine-specific restriction endonuclease McrA
MVDAPTRTLVWERAGNRCEYCRVHQDDVDFYTFHVEHIIPLQHGGSDDEANLCLACREWIRHS